MPAAWALALLCAAWASRGLALPRAATCGASCSQDLACRSRSSWPILRNVCRPPPVSKPVEVLEGLTLSAALQCVPPGGCALRLRVQATVSLHRSLRGLEACSSSLDTQETQCQVVRLPKASRLQAAGQQLQVHFECFEASVGQTLHVTLRTIPHFCGVQLAQEYRVPDCSDEDMRRHIPECSARKLTCQVDHSRRAVLVQVPDAPEAPGGSDYYVRLCRKWFTCQDVVGPLQVPANRISRTVSLPYTQALPCLCLEGWPATPDAVRVQICPFENDTDALWDAIHYHPMSRALSWEPTCPVSGHVSLCWRAGPGTECRELEQSQRPAHRRVQYPGVDPQPQLCLQFSTRLGAHLRCPFLQWPSSGEPGRWLSSRQPLGGPLRVPFLSPGPAGFQAHLCRRGAPTCRQVAPTFPVGPAAEPGVAVADLPGAGLCEVDTCVQGWKTDVPLCSPQWQCDPRAVSGWREVGTWVSLWPAGVCLLDRPAPEAGPSSLPDPNTPQQPETPGHADAPAAEWGACPELPETPTRKARTGHAGGPLTWAGHRGRCGQQKGPGTGRWGPAARPASAEPRPPRDTCGHCHSLAWPRFAGLWGTGVRDLGVPTSTLWLAGGGPGLMSPQ